MSGPIYKIRGVHIVVIILVALVATLAFFARPPEALFVISDDGRASLEGVVPELSETIRIVSGEPLIDQISEDIHGPIYMITPSGFLLPEFVTFTVQYDKEDMESDTSMLSLAWWNMQTGQWEPVPSTINEKTQRVHAPIRHLRAWTLLVR